MGTPYFNDDNTLEDIQGCIYVAQDYKSTEPGKSPTQMVEEVIARIEAKLAKNTNRIRHNWFSLALDFARQAAVAYAAGRFEEGKALLRKTEEHLVSGNKAHRRKTAFIVDPDGVAHSVNETVKSKLLSGTLGSKEKKEK